MAEAHQTSQEGQVDFFLSQRLCDTKTDTKGLQLPQNILRESNAGQASQPLEKPEDSGLNVQQVELKIHFTHQSQNVLHQIS